MATSRDRRAVSQRARRLAARACGNCGSPDELMITWGDGQTLAICRSCKARLDSQPPMEPYCAFYEEPSARFRPDGRGLPEEASEEEFSKPAHGPIRAAWKWIRDL